MEEQPPFSMLRKLGRREFDSHICSFFLPTNRKQRRKQLVQSLHQLLRLRFGNSLRSCKGRINSRISNGVFVLRLIKQLLGKPLTVTFNLFPHVFLLTRHGIHHGIHHSHATLSHAPATDYSTKCPSIALLNSSNVLNT